MTLFGVVHLVLASVCAMLAVLHGGMYLAGRDAMQRTLALCLFGFAGLDLAVAGSSTSACHDLTLGPHPPWLIASSAAFVVLAPALPTLSWHFLRATITPTRIGFAMVGLAMAVVRLGFGIRIATGDALDMSFEQYEQSSTSSSIVLTSIYGLLVATGWVIEGVLARRRGAPYAWVFVAAPLPVVGVMVWELLLNLTMVEGVPLVGVTGTVFALFVSVIAATGYVRSHHAPAVGDIGRYRILKPLASGGFGDLFLAERAGPAGFSRLVALKRLQAFDDPTSTERFLDEARVAAHLRHPNIVDVYDLGTWEKGLFIVMEYIAGVTLSAVIERERRLATFVPPVLASEVGVQICRGLAFAHQAGVIHRDVKRQNVMLGFDGIVRVIDFGIAQEHKRPDTGSRPALVQSEGGRLTVAGAVIGTPGYIAPERLFGERATAASDVFAVGVVLYELLTLRLPFPAEGYLEFARQVEEGHFAPLTAMRPDIPMSLAAIVERCLAFQPSRRFVSAEALLGALASERGAEHVDLSKWAKDLFPDEVHGEEVSFRRTERPTVPGG